MGDVSGVFRETDMDDEAERGLQDLCHFCCRALGVSGASIVLNATGQTATHAVASDSATSAVEDAQFVYGEGPSVDVARSNELISVRIDATFNRWTNLTVAMRSAGFELVIGAPLNVGAVRLGVLDVYGTDDGPSEKRVRETADIVTAMLLARRDSGFLPAADPLQLPEVIGAGVHQATGMIAAQLDCSTSEALVRLRARAYSEGQPLRDVAKAVLMHQIRVEP